MGLNRVPSSSPTLSVRLAPILSKNTRARSSLPSGARGDEEGRRFSGTLSSSRGTETVIAVISQSGTIYMVDDDGYSLVTMLAPNRLESCYLLQSPTSRVASCTEFTKQP